MSFDRTRRGCAWWCARCGEEGVLIQIQIRAAQRAGLPANSPRNLGSRSRSFCDDCASTVFDALEAILTVDQ